MGPAPGGTTTALLYLWVACHAFACCPGAFLHRGTQLAANDRFAPKVALPQRKLITRAAGSAPRNGPLT